MRRRPAHSTTCLTSCLHAPQPLPALVAAITPATEVVVRLRHAGDQSALGHAVAVAHLGVVGQLGHARPRLGGCRCRTSARPAHRAAAARCRTPGSGTTTFSTCRRPGLRPTSLPSRMTTVLYDAALGLGVAGRTRRRAFSGALTPIDATSTPGDLELGRHPRTVVGGLRGRSPVRWSASTTWPAPTAAPPGRRPGRGAGRTRRRRRRRRRRPSACGRR